MASVTRPIGWYYLWKTLGTCIPYLIPEKFLPKTIILFTDIDLALTLH